MTESEIASYQATGTILVRNSCTEYLNVFTNCKLNFKGKILKRAFMSFLNIESTASIFCEKFPLLIRMRKYRSKEVEIFWL